MRETANQEDIMTYTDRHDAIAREITEPIEAGDATAAEFDIDAIADEVLAFNTDTRTYACTVDPAEFWGIVEQHHHPLGDVPAFGHQFEHDLPTVWGISEHGHPVSMRWDGEGIIEIHVLDPLDEVDLTDAERGWVGPGPRPRPTADDWIPGQYGNGDVPSWIEHELRVDNRDYAELRGSGHAPTEALIAIATDALDTVHGVVKQHVWEGLMTRAKRRFRRLVDEVRDGTAEIEDYRPVMPESMWEVTVEVSDWDRSVHVVYELPDDDGISMAQAGIPADDIAAVESWAQRGAAL